MVAATERSRSDEGSGLAADGYRTRGPGGLAGMRLAPRRLPGTRPRHGCYPTATRPPQAVWSAAYGTSTRQHTI